MEFNLTSYQTNEIFESVRSKHHQVNLKFSIHNNFKIACRKFFVATHPNCKDTDDVAIHPNGYFEASLNASSQNEKGKDRNNGKYSSNKPKFEKA